MKIDYKIIVDGVDRTKNFKLVSMSIKDELGESSDSLEITVDDEGSVTELPTNRVILKPYIGLENGLIDCGEYTLDHVETSGFPAMVSLFATAVPLNSSMGSRREKSWINFTLAEIVQEIAERYGFAVAVNDELGAIHLAHINQTSSDIHFLRSLARKYGATFKVHTRHLIFVKKGSSASGLLRTVKIDSNIKRDWRHIAAPLSQYTGVRASYYDSNKDFQAILAGSEAKVYSLKATYKDKEEAERAAIARLESLKSGSESLSFSLDLSPGLNPLELTAGQKIEITKLRNGIDGEWLIKNIEHTLASANLESKIECERGPRI